MSKHNYSQHYRNDGNSNGKTGVAPANAAKPKNQNNNPNYNKPKTIEETKKPVVEAVVNDVAQPKVTAVHDKAPNVAQSKPQLVQETLETKPLPETVEGVVTGCAKLNVRSEASLFADVVCVLDAMSEIEIDVNKSDKDWFYVCTATGIEGYCMRKYVEAHL